MLLESDLNRFASGSGSVPAPGSTFDEVTRQTALNAAAAAAEFLDRRAVAGTCVWWWEDPPRGPCQRNAAERLARTGRRMGELHLSSSSQPRRQLGRSRLPSRSSAAI